MIRARALKTARLAAAPIAGAIALVAMHSEPAAAKQLPAYQELAPGRFTGIPPEKSRPSSIPSTETVSGFRVVPGTRSGNNQVVTLVVDTPGRPAPSSVDPPRVPSTLETVDGCFAQAPMPAPSPSPPFGVNVPSPRPEWETNFSWQTMIWTGQGTPRQPVPVHYERVVETATSATLESTDLWIDPQTLGLRLIGKGSVPLRHVGDAPGGVRFYVGRDDRPDGKHFVQFVVQRSKNTPFQEAQTARGARSDGAIISAGACSHHRVALSADKGGENATLQFTTVLPPLGPNEHSSAPPLPSALPGQHVRDVRARTVRASFSVSQTSRDKDPILSLSTSWGSAETTQRLFDPSSVAPASIAPVPTQRGF